MVNRYDCLAALAGTYVAASIASITSRILTVPDRPLHELAAVFGSGFLLALPYAVLGFPLGLVGVVLLGKPIVPLLARANRWRWGLGALAGGVIGAVFAIGIGWFERSLWSSQTDYVISLASGIAGGIVSAECLLLAARPKGA